MFLIVDSFDSYVMNLSSCIEELGNEVVVIREDRVSLDIVRSQSPEGLILSPGPGRPSKESVSLCSVMEFSGQIPILGVCLGHQTICSAFGADIINGTVPMHGKVTPIHHNGKGLFTKIPDDIFVTRYNSLCVDPITVPACMNIDAVDETGGIMAVSHRSHPTFGVQFHPESFMTEYGKEIIENFINIAKGWRE